MSPLPRRAVALFVLALSACGAPAPPRSGGSVDAAREGARAAVGAPGATGKAAAADPAELGPIPVSSADPQLGDAAAPVTIVEFGDFQCPYCARAAATMHELARSYGPARLRIVWKNEPLAFHAQARPAADAAMAVFQARGDAGFWAFHDALFGAGRAPDEAHSDALSRPGVSKDELERLLAGGGAQRKVDEDLALAGALGVSGTPEFFVNGVPVHGAQPAAAFAEVIDRELAEAAALVKAGTPPARVSAVRTEKNHAVEAAKPKAKADDDDDDGGAPQRVPVGGSPVRGKASALVTLVEFSDFQCPFCARVEPTLQRLSAELGDSLRIVWKNDPLPFHKRAEPAAELALEARAQKGDAAFWQVHDLLFQAPRLEDADLEAVAARAGLDVPAAMRAVASHKHLAAIEADTDLADDVGANGTPHFFVNGRRLVGAQPFERFRAVVGEELARANALVRAGKAPGQVYDELQKTAAAPVPPPKVAVPPIAKESPTKGPAGAKVTVHEFGDFQCPYTRRVQPTVDALLKAFPGQVRVVWHDLPLPMHPDARPAAVAARAALAYKGPAAFWKMHDLFFTGDDPGLARADLEAAGAKVGLDVARLRGALDGHAFDAALEADGRAAEASGVHATPVFVINGYLLEGAQPLSRFKKVVRRALEEAGHPSVAR